MRGIISNVRDYRVYLRLVVHPIYKEEEDKMRSEEQIEEQIHAAGDIIMTGKSVMFGMSYEEGVDFALRWVLEEGDDLPIEED